MRNRVERGAWPDRRKRISVQTGHRRSGLVARAPGPRSFEHRAPGNLEAVARDAGIETSYLDYAGKRHHASEETLRAILDLLRRDDLTRAGNFIEPVIVAWDGKLRAINLPRKQEITEFRLRLRLEDGRSSELELRRAHAAKLDNLSAWLRKNIGKDEFPLGYHQLEVESSEGISRTLIISTPKASYSSRSVKGSCGIFMPLHALHSARSWGAGNFTDLEALGEWATRQGARVLCTLPLLAGFLEGTLQDPSPYSPISRLFWNEFYVDIERLPEFASCKAAQRKVRSPAFQKRLRASRQSDWVEYATGMRLRREVMELLAVAANSEALERFARERPLVREYARFRAVRDRLNRPWQQWPMRLGRRTIQSGDFSERDERYHLYAQFAAERQIERAIRRLRDKGVELYLDLPVGVNRHGFDVWRNQDLFVSDANVGAPPDMFFSKGQNWNFPPMNPDALRETGYRHVIDYLRFQLRHAGMLRIDHVMGLHRLYWIPAGFPAGGGAYVRYRAEELHAIVSLESHRNRCEIVGENLGIVPEEVNRAMDRHRYRKMYVVQFEQRPGKRPLKTPPENCVAMLDTHDTPTFTAYWRGLDIPLRVRLGHLTRTEAAAERAKRKELVRDTLRFLAGNGLLKSQRAGAREVMSALIAWLRRSKAELTLISVEDLFEETRPQNVPGVWREYRNWQRKARLSLEEISDLQFAI